MKANFFNCKNLAGGYPALENELRLGTPTAVFGVSDSHKYLLTSALSEKILYLTADSVSANKAYASLSALSGKKCALLPSKDEVVLYKDALSKDALFRRLTAINAIIGGAEIIVADAEAVMQLVPAEIDKISIKMGNEYDYLSLPEKLIQMGYTREYSVESKGAFAVRGDILDIYPINCDNPLRIDFFGDTAERIRPYDAVSGERLEEVDFAEIVTATDAAFTAEDVNNIKSAFVQGFKSCPDTAALRRSKAIAEEVISKLELGAPFAGASFVIPLLQNSCTLFDILGREFAIVFD